ncbi:MAG: arylsulfatase, partial [Imperialibacter sp.]
AGGKMPEKKIDGKDVWSVITGSSKQSPHEAYFIYYRVNELQAVRSGEWKLYLPHTYRTLAGREGTNDGLPIDYEQTEVIEPELYNLDTDMEETTDVANANPEVVERLLKLADGIRQQLGDKLTGVEGKENREPGRIASE